MGPTELLTAIQPPHILHWNATRQAVEILGLYHLRRPKALNPGRKLLDMAKMQMRSIQIPKIPIWTIPVIYLNCALFFPLRTDGSCFSWRNGLLPDGRLSVENA